MTWRLFLDDIRDPSWVYPDDPSGWIVCRNYAEALDQIRSMGDPFVRELRPRSGRSNSYRV